MSDRKETVMVLGASNKRERYANLAFHRLKEHGHRVLPINPRENEIEGEPCYPSPSQAPAGPVDSITVYIAPHRLEALIPEILQRNPRRVIFNPGSESALSGQFKEAGVEVVEACTLVMLGTGQF